MHRSASLFDTELMCMVGMLPAARVIFYSLEVKLDASRPTLIFMTVRGPQRAMHRKAAVAHRRDYNPFSVYTNGRSESVNPKTLTVSSRKSNTHRQTKQNFSFTRGGAPSQQSPNNDGNKKNNDNNKGGKGGKKSSSKGGKSNGGKSKDGKNGKGGKGQSLSLIHI